MILFKNKYIPIGDFDCMNILGILFIKPTTVLHDFIINHEKIHTYQQYELLIVSLLPTLLISYITNNYLWLLLTIPLPIVLYIILWIVEIILPPYDTAYRDSVFEKEAYDNETNLNYLKNRKPFAWIKYFKLKHLVLFIIIISIIILLTI